MIETEKEKYDEGSENMSMITGKDVIPYLAQTYQQLYLDPGKPGSAEAYKDIVLSGQDAPEHDLSHFLMNDEDCFELLDTPAGPVQTVTLHEREDFELFLQILGNKCIPYEVPATQGAVILDGLVNWQKIRDHKAAWKTEMLERGELFPDWSAEFKRFTADRSNYRDALIILSTGPYSNIPASAVGLDEEEWRRLSLIIRKYHECTHFVCRRTCPGNINAVRDEIVADAAGIIAAFGKFDPETEELFFGIKGSRYLGGRLENYVSSEDEDMDRLAAKVHEAIMRIDGLYDDLYDGLRASDQDAAPFAFALRLTEVLM